MKVAFFGTPQFAVATLQRLVESGHEVVCVFSQPDKPAGRGRKLTAPPVKQIAEAAGIPVYQPASAKDDSIAAILRDSPVDVAVVVAYGKILPAKLLELPRYGFLNVHASLLPKYRGAAPIQWAIVRGERETGVTIMQITEGLDAGPIVAMERLDILEDDDAVSLFNALSYLGADLMVRTLDDIEVNGVVEASPQDDRDATFAPMIKREDARIEWKTNPERLICLVRGFVQWPQAFTRLNEGEVKITGAEAVAAQWMTVDWKNTRIQPGTVVDIIKGRGFVVKTGDDGVMLVTRLKFEGKKEMAADDAVNGNLIRIGMRFE